jgi:surface protein
MFDACYRLTTMDLSSFNTQNVVQMSSMFSYCRSLKSIDLSSFNTRNVEQMGSMFIGCSSLISLDLSSFRIYNTTNMCYMFCECSNLKEVKFDNRAKRNVYAKHMFGPNEAKLIYPLKYKQSYVDILAELPPTWTTETY